MKAPTPKEVVNEWFERVWNSRDKAAIARMMTEDAVAHLAGGAQVCGTTEFSDFQDKLIGAFPDLAVRILRSVGDDKQACLHWEASGTHRGDFFEIAPTNRKVNFSGMSFVTVRDGKNYRGMGLLGLWVLDDHAFFSERLKIRMPPLALKLAMRAPEPTLL
jgi:steroid delta-isomerase-like uncharacterized protein